MKRPHAGRALTDGMNRQRKPEPFEVFYVLIGKRHVRPLLSIAGVNAKGGFGVWCHDVAFEMAKIHDILERHGTA